MSDTGSEEIAEDENLVEIEVILLYEDKEYWRDSYIMEKDGEMIEFFDWFEEEGALKWFVSWDFFFGDRQLDDDSETPEDVGMSSTEINIVFCVCTEADEDGMM